MKNKFKYINSDTVLIYLTQNQTTLIDASDFEFVQKFKWCALKNNRGNYYAVTNIRTSDKSQRKLWLHRLLINTKKGLQVDHKNMNSLDNRKSNLRICTHSENQMNCKAQSNNLLGVKGVSKNLNGTFRATIKFNGVSIHIGTFKTLEEAKNAYNKKALELCPSFARIN